MTNHLAPQLVRALFAHFESEKEKSLAIIDWCLTTGPSRPDLVLLDLVAATERLASAEQSISTINRHFIKKETEENE